MLPDQPDMASLMPLLEEYASKADVIVEIGCGHGNGSTRAFARGMLRNPTPDDGKFYLTIDGDITNPDEPPDLPYWSIIHGRSEHPQTLYQAQIALGGDPPDILFIDTDHTREQLTAELALWGAIAGPATVWLFHDTWMFGTYNPMVEAIDEYIAKYPEWEYIELTKDSHGLGMMRWKQ